MIANHALYFAHLAAGGGVLPEHDAVVFDEAHRLEETAASWLGGRVSRAGLRRLAADVERACREAVEPLPARALDRIERAGERCCSGSSRPDRAPAAARAARVETTLVLVDALGCARRGAAAGAPRGSTCCRQRALTLAPRSSAAWSRPASSGSSGPSPTRIAWAPVDVSSELRGGSGRAARRRSSSRRR